MANKTWTGASSGSLNTAGNWSPSGVPAAGDNVTFPAGAPSVTANLTSLNNAALTGALGTVIIEPGYTGTIGAAGVGNYFQFSCSQFHFSGSGLAYIDLEASAITAHVYGTARPTATGLRGLYLLGSALNTLDAQAGWVGLAAQFVAETSAVTTVRNVGADLILKSGVTSPTTIEHTGGTTEIHCGATTVNVYNGVFRSREAGTITTLNVGGGQVFPESSGTITTANLNGGTTDFRTSGTARTVTNLKLNPGAILAHDPSVLTITNKTNPDYPVQVQATAG